MCRGLGKVQRSILALLEARPGEAFTVCDVAEAIYPGCAKPRTDLEPAPGMGGRFPRAKPPRPQIDAIARALKTMRLPGGWRTGYVQGGGGRRWLYRNVDSIARRMRRLEWFEVQVEPAAQPDLVQATNGVWFALGELEPITTTIILTGFPDKT
jgi:hypothetical protein